MFGFNPQGKTSTPAAASGTESIFGDGGFMGMLGSEGFANGAGAFNTFAQMYTGFKGLQMAKKQLKFQKKAFNMNFDASAKDYDNQLKNDWMARDSADQARGGDGNYMGGMDKWVADRSIVPGKTQAAPAGFGESDPAAFQQDTNRQKAVANRGGG